MRVISGRFGNVSSRRGRGFVLTPLLLILALAVGVTPALAAPPGNDNIANATQIPPGQGSGAGNTEATAETNEPAHAGNTASRSIWFRFTAANAGLVEIDTCGSAFDTVLAVYTGPADVTQLTPVVSADNGAACGGGASLASFTATAGTTYRIALDGKAGAVGSTQIFIRAQPANSNFADAQQLNGSTIFSTPGANFFGGAEPFEPAHFTGQPATNSVWFKWTPDGDGTAEIDTCTTGLDTILAAYTGTSFGGLTQVASNDDTPGCFAGASSQVSFPVVHGTTYRIAVDGKAGAQGEFSLDVLGPPDNDLFALAQDLGDSPTSTSGSNERAGTEPGEGNHAGVVGGHSVWFKWTADQSGPVRIRTCDSTIDTLLAVYTGSTVAGKTLIAANDDGGGSCSAGASDLSFAATAETTYRIAIDGKAGAQGSYELQLATDNDDFADAALIGGTFVNYNGSTDDATTEAGEPNHAGVAGSGSVWFRWTAPVSGLITVEACGNGNFDPLLAVYTGASVSALGAPVVSNDDGGSLNCDPQGSVVTFTATLGTTYRIAVDGNGAGEGDYNLNLTGPSDTAVPDTSILTGPSGPTPSANPVFTYAAVPAFDVSFFECRLDSNDPAVFGECPAGGRSFNGLADGVHTFDVRAIDFSNNVDASPASRTFTVDTAAPDTSITSGPSGTITTSEATFTYAGSADATAFQCSLDSAAFASCPNSGTSLSGLADGTHAFAVRALDAAGNTDATPASQAFTVDTAVSPPPEDLCTPAKEKLKAAKAKLRKAKNADKPDQERIDKLKKKVKKLKAKVEELC